MRIALFGGTFDPIHRGHLAIAAAAADTFSLDTILFAPTGLQPLKPNGATASFADRLAMTTLACEQSGEVNPNPHFAVSAIDAPRPDHQPNYTVDTLADLHQLYPGATLFALAGADSFLGLPRWRQPDRLFELAEWIVVSRPGFSLDDLASLALAPHQLARVHLLLGVHEPVSSTSLRERLRAGDPCDDLLPASVSRYIRQHHLYR
jgi:nicotinate-nucleotide adenylyltransferase